MFLGSKNTSHLRIAVRRNLLHTGAQASRQDDDDETHDSGSSGQRSQSKKHHVLLMRSSGITQKPIGIGQNLPRVARSRETRTLERAKAVIERGLGKSRIESALAIQVLTGYMLQYLLAPSPSQYVYERICSFRLGPLD